jgi:hypothetical protein
LGPFCFLSFLKKVSRSCPILLEEALRTLHPQQEQVQKEGESSSAQLLFTVTNHVCLLFLHPGMNVCLSASLCVYLVQGESGEPLDSLHEAMLQSRGGLMQMSGRHILGCSLGKFLQFPTPAISA